MLLNNTPLNNQQRHAKTTTAATSSFNQTGHPSPQRARNTPLLCGMQCYRRKKGELPRS